MKRKELLEESIKCICTDRNDQYGGPEDSFALIAKYWNTYLGLTSGITPEDVGIMMALLKIARMGTGKPKDDNYIDAAGYIACAGGIALGEKDE